MNAEGRQTINEGGGAEEVGLRGGWLHQQFDDYTLLRTRDAATGEAWITRWF